MRNCIIIFYFVSSVKRTFDRILYFNILLLTVSALRLFVSVGHSSHGKPSAVSLARSFIRSFVRCPYAIYFLGSARDFCLIRRQVVSSVTIIFTVSCLQNAGGTIEIISCKTFAKRSLFIIESLMINKSSNLCDNQFM